MDQSSQEMRKKLESASLEENLERIDYLLKETKTPGAHALGMKLALLMAMELRQGKPPGTDTGNVVSAWIEEYGQGKVEEAITFARQFLLKPQELTEQLAEKIFSGEEITGEDVAEEE